jgi:hypothetical protein
MSHASKSDEVVYSFHFSTLAMTLLVVFLLSMLMVGAPWTAALISLVGVLVGFARARSPGRVRLPFQKVGFPAGELDGLIAVACFALPLFVSVVIGLGISP